MSYRGSSATILAPLFVTILCQSGCGTAETAPEPQTTATTSAASARDAQLARDARRLLRRDYGDSASAPSWFPLVQLDKIRAEDGVVTVPTEVGDDADKTGPVNAICAVPGSQITRPTRHGAKAGVYVITATGLQVLTDIDRKAETLDSEKGQA